MRTATGQMAYDRATRKNQAERESVIAQITDEETRQQFQASIDTANEIQRKRTLALKLNVGVPVRTWLAVPYAEKEEAKAAGARWDKQTNRWFAPPNTPLIRFSLWLTY